MDTILYKYYKENMPKLLNETIEFNGIKYNFYDITKWLDYQNLDTTKLRKICELNFKIYNVLIKPFISIPTTKTDRKKKYLEKLFSIALKEPNFIDSFIERYHKSCLNVGLKRCARTFYSFSLSEMPYYDLDSVNDISGFARIGKSMLTLEIMREIYQFRLNLRVNEATEYILKNNILGNDIIYNDTSPFISNIRESSKKIFIGDESYFIADRREAMYNKQIEMSHMINAYANKNHTFFMLIQNLTDMDTRFINKANTILLLTERGEAYVFAKEKHYSLLKDHYGFEIFIKKPYLLSNRMKGEYNLKRLPSYCFTLKWDNMKDDPIFIEYKRKKEEAQIKYKTFSERMSYLNKYPKKDEPVDTTYLNQMLEGIEVN